MANQAAQSGTESENLRKQVTESNYANPYSMRPADSFMDSQHPADDEMTVTQLKKMQAA